MNVVVFTVDIRNLDAILVREPIDDLADESDSFLGEHSLPVLRREN